jgi:hypothetical protein
MYLYLIKDIICFAFYVIFIGYLNHRSSRVLDTSGSQENKKCLQKVCLGTRER